MTTAARWAWAEVDLDAIAHNVGVVREVVQPAQLWAVVKADGYGHGAVPVAQVALRAGAAGLCVALVEEGVALRTAGIEAPILVLSEQPSERLGELVAHGLTATAYRVEGIDALAAAVRAAGRTGHRVHLKVDTGMHRVGAAPADVGELVEAVARAAPALVLDGIYTHLPVADDPRRPETCDALGALAALVDDVARSGHHVAAVHAANSAAALAFPDSRLSMVRAGIALYGLTPGPGVAHLCGDLRPALSLHARVSFVKRVPAGHAVSYGLREPLTRDTTVATLPIGYADGVPRALSLRGATVLLGGRRRPILGVVTMDQLMVGCGDDEVAVGDHAVLLGTQGAERIDAEEWARLTDTIGYEIVARIGPRIERLHRCSSPVAGTRPQ